MSVASSTFRDARNAWANQRGKRARRRERKRRRVSAQRRARRTLVLKACLCVGVVVLFLVLALVVGDGDYHATAIGWVPFFLVVLCIASAFAYLQVLKRSLRFTESSDVGDCQRDRDVRFTVHFSNASPLFFFRIEAYFYISDLFGDIASEAMTTLALSPHEEYDLGFTTKFEHIGTYTAGLDRVVLCDFLGLFTATIRNERRKQVNVTPKLQAIDNMQFSNDALLETTKAAKSVLADSMDYSHVREYVPGDPLKTIHWKLSARADHYMTRLYEVYTNPGVGIIMDFYGPSDEATELMGMFDAVVESAFSVGRHAREKGMDTELFYRDKHGQARRLETWSRDDMPRIIDDMPRMSNNPTDAAGALDLLRDQIVSRYGQNNIVVCSANVGSEMVSTVIEAKIRRRAPLLIAVVPRGMVGRERDAYCKSLSRLDAADIPYLVLASSNELEGVRA